MRTGFNKRVNLALCLLLLTLVLHGQDWQLVWSDEFDGDALDMARWSYMTGDGSEYGIPGWGNNEEQYYLEQNVVVDDTVLRIFAKQQMMGGKSYTSGRIRTIDKGDWIYCRAEFRAKMPVGKGLWAAIWMLPTDSEYGGWAASGEIDIMEYLGDDTRTVHGTLHFGGEWPENASKGTAYGLPSGDFSEEFHDFALEWEEGEMRWYVDDKLYQTQGQGDWWSYGAQFPAPFNRRFHLLINLAVGGNWPGSPDVSTMFPQELVLDYVRIYQRGGTGTGGAPVTDAGAYALEQNFPNPSRSRTHITYTTQAAEHVHLEVFDPLGRKIRTLVDGVQLPGTHMVEMERGSLPPGIYTYRLRAGMYTGYRQMVFLRL